MALSEIEHTKESNWPRGARLLTIYLWVSSWITAGALGSAVGMSLGSIAGGAIGAVCMLGTYALFLKVERCRLGELFALVVPLYSLWWTWNVCAALSITTLGAHNSEPPESVLN